MVQSAPLFQPGLAAACWSRLDDGAGSWVRPGAEGVARPALQKRGGKPARPRSGAGALAMAGRSGVAMISASQWSRSFVPQMLNHGSVGGVTTGRAAIRARGGRAQPVPGALRTPPTQVFHCEAANQTVGGIHASTPSSPAASSRRQANGAGGLDAIVRCRLARSMARHSRSGVGQAVRCNCWRCPMSCCRTSDLSCIHAA